MGHSPRTGVLFGDEARARGFRQQVRSLLRNSATEGRTSAQRLQQRVGFERLFARLGGDPEWVLKCGFALERILDAVGKEKSLRTSLKRSEEPGTDPEPQCVNEARDARVVVGLGYLNEFALDQ